MAKILTQDRSFERMVDKFEQKVYGTLKGEWRLKLLKQDLAKFVTNSAQPDLVAEDLADQWRKTQPFKIWDAGCGLAQISLWLAENLAEKTELTLCDLSPQMVYRAEQNFASASQSVATEFFTGAAQDLAPTLPDFDLVLFHAVLEWLAEPKASLQTIANKVKSGGHLSLLFYNRNAFVFSNVLKGEWRWQHVLDDSYLGKGKNLTPPNPQFPHEVTAWLTDWGFEIEIQTGIRVFHDYLTDAVMDASNLDELLALEEKYCRVPTYRDMARYIHILARKKPDNFE